MSPFRYSLLFSYRYLRLHIKAKVLPVFVNVLVVLVLISGIACRDARAAGSNEVPFRPGEKLTYELSWEFIPVGTAVLEVLPMENVGGVEAYHFLVTIKTNSFADTFYKVRDRIDAYADAAMSRSLLYKQKQQEGKHKGDIAITFDWSNNQAQYSGPAKNRAPISIVPGTFDPLSVFYSFRLNRLREMATLEAHVTDGKKLVRGKAMVLDKENVEVPAGKFDTFLVEPDLKDIGGVFRKSKNAKLLIWVSADGRHMPVKITSSVAVGDFIAKLVSVE